MKKEEEYLNLSVHDLLDLDCDLHHDALRSVALMKVRLLRLLIRLRN